MKSGRIMQWLIPTTLLVAFIVVMFLLFSAKIEQRGQDIVEENIVMSTEEYALRIDAELAQIESSVNYAVNVVEKYGAFHNINKNLMEALCEVAPAYMAVMVNSEGTGVSNTGTVVELSGQSYFYHIKNGNHWFSVEEDGITGKSALVYTVEAEDDTYILAYYNIKDIFKMVQLESYSKQSFLALIDNEYELLITQGEADVYLIDGNLKTTINRDRANMQAIKAMNIDFKNEQPGSQVVTVDGDVRSLCYAPLGIDNFYVVVGVENSYVITEGSTYYTEATSMLFAMIIAIGVFFFLVIIINLISKIVDKKQKSELQLKADTDLLTGLTNKAATERMIQEYIHQEPNGVGVLFIIDIDNFKKINDTMGHAFGDEVLKELGHQLRSMFRATDVVGRFGGDEFLVFMKDVKDPNVIKRDADRLKDFFRNFKAGEYVKYSVGASIGASVYTEDGKDFETLFKMADKALYVVKRRGKNNLAFYSDVKDEAESQLIDYRGRED